MPLTGKKLVVETVRGSQTGILMDVKPDYNVIGEPDGNQDQASINSSRYPLLFDVHYSRSDLKHRRILIRLLKILLIDQYLLTLT